MRPEPARAIAILRPLPVNRILQTLVKDEGVRHGFGGERCRLAHQGVVGDVADEVSGPGGRDRRIDAGNIGDLLEMMLPRGVDIKGAHGVGVIIDGNARRYAKGNQPEEIFLRSAGWARENAHLILNDMERTDLGRAEHAFLRTLAPRERGKADGDQQKSGEESHGRLEIIIRRLTEFRRCLGLKPTARPAGRASLPSVPASSPPAEEHPRCAWYSCT